MSLRKKARPAFRRPLQLESLEQRQVLAGNITALLSGANLLITGDNAANSLSIEPVAAFPGRVVITPLANADGATLLNGKSTPLTLPSFGEIRISLGNGNDTLDFSGDETLATDRVLGSLVIDGGRGNNSITVSNYNIGGSLVIRNSTGDDTVVVDNVDVILDIVVSNDSAAGSQSTDIQQGTTAGRDISISARGGDHDIDLGDTSTTGTVGAVAIGRQLLIQNLGAVTDDATINLHAVNIATNLTITNTSTATINLGTGTGPLSVGHNTAIRNGNGDNELTVQNGSEFGTTAVDRFSLLNGSGADTIDFQTSAFNAQVDLRNNGGDADITAADDALFNEALSINNGNGGTHAVAIESATVGSLSVFNGTGTSNSVLVGTVSSVDIDGRVSITNGNATANNRIEINNATLSAPVLLSNGNVTTGTNTAYVGTIIPNAVTTSSSLAIYNGNGNTDVQLDNVDADGSVSVSSGTAAVSHQLTVGETGLVTIGGNLSIYAYAGDAAITIDQAAITGNLSVRTGAGADDLTIAGPGGAGVTVNGTTYISLGAGGDTLTIGDDAGTATLVDALTVLMGTGTDDILLGPNTDGTPGTAIGDGFFLFDGGVDALGLNTISIDATVIDPFIDLATFNRFRNLVITVI